MKSDIHIRAAAPDDAPLICRLLQQLGYEQAPTALAEKIGAGMRGGLAFVAELDGAIVGFISLHIVDRFHRQDTAARLSAVVVDGSYRRSGIGRALVGFGGATACRLGCSTMELTSNVRRKAGGTYDFYAALGYQPAEKTTYFRKSLRRLATQPSAPVP